MMFQEKIKVVSNKKLSEDYFKLRLNSARITSFAKPGQFVQVKVQDADTPFLRRPFGIHHIGSGAFDILGEIVGKGSEILSKKKPGEYLDVIGPLGSGFTFNIQHSTFNMLIAGGMGVAPLIFLAEQLAERRAQSAYRKILVLLGSKTKSEILCEDEFRKLGCKVEVSTDDGSRGFKGKVTDLLKHLLTTNNYRLSTIYACGPKPMLKEASFISKEHNIPAQVSLEEHLACGIGACLGCVVNTKKGFKRVCKEGPVFDSEEIIW